MRKTVGGTGVLIAAMLLITAMTAGQAPAKQGNPTASAAKKCKPGFVKKKVKTKNGIKKKCVKKNQPGGGGTTTPPTPVTPTQVKASMTISCPANGTSGSAPNTVSGTLVGDTSGGRSITFNYTVAGPTSFPSLTATVTTAPGGNWSFTFTPNQGGTGGWGNSVNATFSGDATLSSAFNVCGWTVGN